VRGWGCEIEMRSGQSEDWGSSDWPCEEEEEEGTGGMGSDVPFFWVEFEIATETSSRILSASSCHEF
jgi:hypothetical protein